MKTSAFEQVIQKI